ncbi:sodium:solute symporter family protein [Celeribacter halophilus]|uniref:Sodium:solute symporter family protein n=1 Tax=Celeribacter halophilus TaxID=576117 RepID=A0AAW7XVD1_9RHOB|nr:sodium:solute symporter family protein [Celeribacter halophilus]MBU2891571.1 cation acetate symporter [Celeribacter halophilus]MDO6458226.1 sodium:solute symporter family protein [Celeribacter halophilus]MDO6509729.1 sodium:solute symporter family protein [Celeribacter halophilus]MDO6724275.1 sodium:solute symporter family protein [Celeribacter halophilus]
MDQFTLNLIVVGATFALYIGIAIWARAGSTAEFYAAGRGVNPVVNGMATGADWMSAASFISMAGIISFGGYNTSAYLMGWTGGYVLLAMLIAPYLRKFGKFTVPEFIGDRFYSQTARTVAVICLITASLTYVIGQMTGVGVAFSRFLEVDNLTGLLIGATIVFFYAVIGGMKGITYTQVAQYVVLITAYTIPAVFISLQLTGNPVPPLGLFSDHVGSGEPLLATLDGMLRDLGFNEFTQQTDTTLNIFLFTMSLMIGTAGLPHVIVRFFTVPTVASARSSAGWSLVFIALLYLTAPAVGAMGRVNLIDTFYPNGTSAEALSVETINSEEKLDWVRNWAQTGLLQYEDKNGDGLITYVADAELNELSVNNDIMVLANPEIANLPSWVIALIAAGGLAAALSTAAGLLMAISSAVSHDLIKSQINPSISEKGELLSARISMAVAIVIATYLGANPPGFAAQTVALAFGLAASSIFPALLMGIFSKRVNNKGAVAGMLAGLGITVVYIFLHKGWFFIPGTNSFTDADPLLLSIKSTSFGAVGALVNFAVAYLVSNATEEPPAEIRELVESVRIPRGAGGAVDH